MPPAKAANETDRLLVVIALEASGLMATMECVHMRPVSIVSIIPPPSRSRSNPGSRRGDGDAGEHPGGEERERGERVGQRLAEDGGEHPRVEVDDAARFAAPARVDQVVGAAEQRIQVAGERRAGGILAGDRQIRRRLAIQ